MTSLVMWHNCHCQCHHMMPVASVSVSHNAYSIINGTIIFLGQDDRSEVQCEFFGHMMPLTPSSASCDADRIVNGTTAFLGLRWLRWGVTWLFGHVMLTGTIFPWNAIYMPHAQITSFASVGKVCQYICHTRSHCDQNCGLKEGPQRDKQTEGLRMH